MAAEVSPSPSLGVRTDEKNFERRQDQDISMAQIKVFVWDTGLTLPSIEPECIAVLAYLKSHERDLPAHQIMIGNDPSESPTGEYPYMQCSADICQHVCLAGFSQIISHLNTEHFYEYPSPQDKSQASQDAALCTFISNKGRQLLDLYLYVSYDNYYSATSSAWTKILPWYQNYVIPPAKRRAAQDRTQHLGVTSLDVDNVHDLPLTGRQKMPSTASPAAKALGTDTAAGAMIAESERRKRIQVFDRSTQSDVFRLRRLAEGFFDALITELQKQSKSYFSAKEPRAMDYLLIGHLSLIVHADVPNKWLANILTESYPDLARWVDRFYERSFGRLPSPQLSMNSSATRHEEQDASTKGLLVLARAILEHVPVLNMIVAPTISTPSGNRADKAQRTRPVGLLAEQKPGAWRSLTLTVLTIASTIGLIVINDGYTAEMTRLSTSLYTTLWRLLGQQSLPPPTKLRDLGEAGSFFLALGP